MSETTYTVEIKETSKELTARDRIKLKDTSNAKKLDSLFTDETLVIKPESYAILTIHNEKADDKDYDNYVIMDVDGNKYVTGSNSFWNSFINIWDEMEKEGETGYEVEVYKRESKNYTGKYFITCSLL